MLSDIREIAERVGEEVLGFPVEWFVETTAAKIGKRPDVEIRRADENVELIASGEAKRPETPAGLHPYVASEVKGAVEKAQSLGGAYAFTTNFLQISLHDVTKYDESDYLAGMLGDPIELIDEKETAVADWWSALTKERRETLVRPGLEMLFSQLRKLRSQQQVVQQSGKDEVYLAIFKAAADSIVAEVLPAFAEKRDTGMLPVPVLDEAKERGFDLSKADVSRYYVAQAVAEVLTSGLFYETVRPSFSLRDRKSVV